MSKLDFLVEDKLEEIFSFLTPLVSPTGLEFEPYFTSGPEQDINPFLVTETARNIYPLIWLVYPYTEKRNNTNVTIENVRLILAIENSNDMLNKQRLEGSYKKALYPLYYNIKDLFTRANNIEVIDGEYSIVKYPNFGDAVKSETVNVWDVLALDFGIKVNKFKHRLKQ
jgi:hypothetical protein